MNMRILAILAAFLALPGRAFGFPPADAPELALRGPHAVGHSVLHFTDESRMEPSPQGTAPRRLDLLVWYPAQSEQGARDDIRYCYPTPVTPGIDPASLPEDVCIAGRAAEGAAPVRGGKFPLLVVSHGFQNSAAMLSWLGESMAAKGHVVAIIEHRDFPVIDDATRQISFATTVLNRSRDQRFVIARLRAAASDGESLLHDVLDPDRIALAGYSMGGFGAVTTAGAGHDPSSPVMQAMPQTMLAGLLEDDVLPPPEGLKAIILFAPWGYQPPYSVWRREALARIEIPVLLIGGDHDDVSDYDRGVRPLWEAMTGSERWLLSFSEARHNIAVLDAPSPLADHFAYRERFDEPVWRKDRLLAVNVHMITAFLARTLGGDEDAASAAMLDVPVEAAGEGSWPLEPGETAGAAYARPDGASAGYWPGFHRRWALGLRLEHRAAGE